MCIVVIEMYDQPSTSNVDEEQLLVNNEVVTTNNIANKSNESIKLRRTRVRHSHCTALSIHNYLVLFFICIHFICATTATTSSYRYTLEDDAHNFDTSQLTYAQSMFILLEHLF
jgi:hypothetical protein